MSMKSKILALKRKSPVQSRSTQTVNTLLDSAAQILEKDGEGRFTTNRIAEIAGYSIGTLYQYFPSKDSIVEAVVQRECSRVEREIRNAVNQVESGNLEAIIRSIVVVNINAFSGRHRARKILISHAIRLGFAKVMPMVLNTIESLIVNLLIETTRNQIRPLSEVTSFVLTRSLTGVVRAAIMEEKSMLKTKEFEDELVRLALCYLKH